MGKTRPDKLRPVGSPERRAEEDQSDGSDHAALIFIPPVVIQAHRNGRMNDDDVLGCLFALVAAVLATKGTNRDRVIA